MRSRIVCGQSPVPPATMDVLSLRMPGDPRSGSKVRETLDREISKPRENRCQVVACGDSQPTAAFHDRENRRNLRSRLWAADVQPILSTKRLNKAIACFSI